MYVYLLQSTSNPKQKYIGITQDIKKRIKVHNAGKVPHTSKFIPWKIRIAICFDDKEKVQIGR
ncbi:MAG: GIY-YIG nuclease family protein [Pseudomonadota bacterium]